MYRRLHSLCANFEVLSTGGTYKHILKILASIDKTAREQIAEDVGVRVGPHDIRRWRDDIEGSLTSVGPGIEGMIEISYELVEQRLDAVIHLTDWEDRSGKPDSAVLWREANVHDVPLAGDVHTATTYIQAWKARLARADTQSALFKKRGLQGARPLDGLGRGDRVLALIAHDAMKLEMCRLVVENAGQIFEQFDYVLATGTTGKWIRRFLHAVQRGPHEIERVRLCNSGPFGGDVQIAYAVVQHICGKVVFLQDPQASHPHEADIKLFEQAVLSSRVVVELATNSESAKLIMAR